MLLLDGSSKGPVGDLQTPREAKSPLLESPLGGGIRT